MESENVSMKFFFLVCVLKLVEKIISPLTKIQDTSPNTGEGNGKPPLLIISSGKLHTALL